MADTMRRNNMIVYNKTVDREACLSYIKKRSMLVDVVSKTTNGEVCSVDKDDRDNIFKFRKSPTINNEQQQLSLF